MQHTKREIVDQTSRSGPEAYERWSQTPADAGNASGFSTCSKVMQQNGTIRMRPRRALTANVWARTRHHETLNVRRVKCRCYSVEEVARLFLLHKNTVRTWIKGGLETIDDQRPQLILGRHLSRFRRSDAAGGDRGAEPVGSLRAMPRSPGAGWRAGYQSITSRFGNLSGSVRIAAHACIGGCHCRSSQRLRETCKSSCRRRSNV
jgi:hypothetical protein